MATIPEAAISTFNGAVRTIPLIGLGTASGKDGVDATKTAVVEAIKVGYRHFDTAALYCSEQALGEGIVEALRLGLIKSREELFITSKLWIDSTERHLVLPAINKSLKNLGLEYLDLYLIHWPFKLNGVDIGEYKFPLPTESVSAIDIKSVWVAMEECQNLGLTKAIGVSNFSSRRLQEILSFANIPPAVNQVEMNPLWQQKELREFCRAKGIHLSAYSALGSSGTAWGDNRVMQNDVLKYIASSKGKTVAQVSIRWLYEQGVSVLVKSYNTERMKENIQIFDWSLTVEELNKINQLAQRKGINICAMSTSPNDILKEIDAELS